MNIIWKDRKRYFGLPISFTKYSLSDSRIFVNTGFLNLHENELLLYRVRDISMHMSLGQRIFGVGTVTVYSSDKTDGILELKNIKNPRNVKEMIFENVEKSKSKVSMKTTELLGDEIQDNDFLE